MVIKKVKALPEDQAKDLLSFLEKLEREEEAFDIGAARKALAEGDRNGFIPWEKVKDSARVSNRSLKADRKR